jgi:hypothetical protein
MIRVSTHARRTRLRSGSKLASVPVNSRPSSIPIYIIDDDDDDACGCVGVFVAALQTRAQQYSGLASAVRCVVHSLSYTKPFTKQFTTLVNIWRVVLLYILQININHQYLVLRSKQQSQHMAHRHCQAHTIVCACVW